MLEPIARTFAKARALEGYGRQTAAVPLYVCPYPQPVFCTL